MGRLLWIAVLAMALGAQTKAPSTEEIAEAYRSKMWEGGTIIPGLRWEKFRITEIRGWSLKFQRQEAVRYPGILIMRYRVVARENQSCIDYDVSQTVPRVAGNPQVKAGLVVNASAVRVCR